MVKRLLSFVAFCSSLFLLLVVRLPVDASPPLVGTVPWTTLLCKFSDVTAEPFTLQDVQVQFGASYMGVSHYWHVQSRGALTLATQTLGWYALPHTQAEYVNMGTDAGRAAILTDCLQAAALTDTAETVTAVVTNVNTTLNGFVTQDVVINPTTVSQMATLIHTSGKALGLTNSTGIVAQTANPWDTLSIPMPACGTLCVIPHVTAYAKMQAGWLTAHTNHPNATTESVYSLTYLDAPAGDGEHLLFLPAPVGFYTLEARRTTEAYVNPSANKSALVIHHVDPAAPIPLKLYATLESENATLSLADAVLTVQVERITSDMIQVRVKPISTETPPVVTPDTTPETTPEITPEVTPNPTTPTPPAPLNYVYNGSFEEKTSASLPMAWARSKLTQDMVMCNTPDKIFANSGVCAFRFRGSATENSQLSQKLLVPNVQRGTILDVSFKVRSQNILRGVTMQVLVYYLDPALKPENITVRSGAGFGQYRYSGASLELAGEVSYVLVKLIYTEPKGIAWVDDVSVTLR